MSSPIVRLYVVPILLTFVKTRCVKTDFPIKTTSNFKQERKYVHIDKAIKKTMKSDKQITIEGRDTSLSTAGRSAGSSSPMFSNSGDDAQVPEVY
jgi:hypothetical protein